MSRPLQCEEAFLKQGTFLNPDLCVLSFGPTKAYRHAILVFCATQHEDLRAGSPNCELTQRTDLLRAPLKCFTYFFDIVLGHLTVWRPMFYQDTSCFFQMLVPLHLIFVNRCCLVWVHMIKLAFSALPITQHNSLSASGKTFQLKQIRTELSCLRRACA
jgi:hypothetical protein